MLIGTALHNARQTGVEKLQAVQDRLAGLACYREGINAHLTAAIALAERSPAGLMMPNQSLLFTGRSLATSQLHHMMNTVREDRKSTRLNSSHLVISYAVFCLKKKKHYAASAYLH